MIYLLIIYLIFLVGYVVYSVIAIYHLHRFGYIQDLTRPAAFLYVLLSLAVIIMSFIFIAALPWSTTVNANPNLIF